MNELLKACLIALIAFLLTNFCIIIGYSNWSLIFMKGYVKMLIDELPWLKASFIITSTTFLSTFVAFWTSKGKKETFNQGTFAAHSCLPLFSGLIILPGALSKPDSTGDHLILLAFLIMVIHLLLGHFIAKQIWNGWYKESD